MRTAGLRGISHRRQGGRHRRRGPADGDLVASSATRHGGSQRPWQRLHLLGLRAPPACRRPARLDGPGRQLGRQHDGRELLVHDANESCWTPAPGPAPSSCPQRSSSGLKVGTTPAGGTPAWATSPPPPSKPFTNLPLTRHNHPIWCVRRTGSGSDYRGQRHRLRMQVVLKTGDRVLLVDDWAERGSQARGAVQLCEQSDAEFLGLSVIVDMLAPEVRASFPRVTTLVSGAARGPS